MGFRSCHQKVSPDIVSDPKFELMCLQSRMRPMLYKESLVQNSYHRGDNKKKLRSQVTPIFAKADVEAASPMDLASACMKLCSLVVRDNLFPIITSQFNAVYVRTYMT